ncbi:MAG: hypothetical protein PHC66_03530 [Candidatus Nanoarchaeia archaeon]|nr:hypothetical protein [Candidatus Nanoarchaeia archaeon]MDD5239807.1 hypothetical protein [Candidatus Nanoarchaeia archaeon]
MKKLLIFGMLFLAAMIILGCTRTEGVLDSVDLYSCNADSDCVPKPGCHASECINQEYTNRFMSPEFCTEMFSCSAAYTPEDCACIDSKCVNKNLGNKGCV